jgi:hypothetical protein
MYFEWDTNMPLHDMIIEAKYRYNKKFFKEALIVGCWTIWNHRNKAIFENEYIDPLTCIFMFKESFSVIMHRAKPSLREGMQQWLDTL